MKFQKTLLAVSLAVAAASTVNAAVVDVVAKPVQVTENLFNPNAVDLYGNPIYTTINGVNGVVSAPVHSVYAKNSGIVDTDLNFSLSPNGTTINSGLPTISWDSNNQIINLGINNVGGVAVPGEEAKYDVFKYKTTDGKTTVYRFQDPKSGKYIDGYYTATFVGNDVNNVPQYELSKLTTTPDINWDSLERGGQIAGEYGTTTVTGKENRQINGEHVVYGYQGGTEVSQGQINGTIVNPEAQEEHLYGTLGQNASLPSEIRYVSTGILANTGTGPISDPSKNIYGVSARDNNNVVMLTGNGLALADLSNDGVLHTDGSITKSDKSNIPSKTQKTREYKLADGTRVVEVYNDDAGRELASTYYKVGADNQLEDYTGTIPVAGSHIKTGTAKDVTGIENVSKIQNTVTQKNVTYKESVVKQDVKDLIAGITTPGGDTTDVNATYQSAQVISKSEQYASAGVVTLEDKSEAYGFKVASTSSGKDVESKNNFTEITSAGINTNGVINAADYQIGGVSIVENIKTSVDEAVGGATEAIDAKVAEVDQKIVEVDSRLTEFNGQATALNSRVDQLNNRIDDVEKTAYRGVAIALAAQQAIPNLNAGQTAVFGGAGVYESEGAGALGVATVLKDGRTSFSGAIGVAGGGEVGGRVGVAYVFGGK